MTRIFNRWSKKYFENQWVPFVFANCIFVFFFNTTYTFIFYINNTISEIITLLYFLSLFGILIAGIYQLFRKQWKKGLISIVLFIISRYIPLVAFNLVYSFGLSFG